MQPGSRGPALGSPLPEQDSPRGPEDKLRSYRLRPQIQCLRRALRSLMMLYCWNTEEVATVPSSIAAEDDYVTAFSGSYAANRHDAC
ncbi:hypothetical protein AOLI_G00142350 [Acnodon oligacanthus]